MRSHDQCCGSSDARSTNIVSIRWMFWPHVSPSNDLATTFLNSAVSASGGDLNTVAHRPLAYITEGIAKRCTFVGS
eukprot:6471551-Amphidinium_carterae.1